MNRRWLFQKGFSLIELMVAVTVLALIMAAVVTLMMNSDKAKRKNEAIIEAQQQGSAAMEMLVRDIRTAGYGVNVGADQPIIAYARPFEIIFNANLNPFPDSLGLRQPRAYDPGIPPLCPNDSVISFFTGGAETYRYTFDSNHDGAIGAADRTDDAVELKTRNPKDYLLIRQTYGRMDDNTNNVFPNRNFSIALLRGPVSAADDSIIPMFQYWYRDIAANELRLWGDADNDSVLTGNERLFANPPQNILAAIEMITITVTTETRLPIDRDQYRRVVVSTTTNLANVPNSKARYGILGKLKVQSTGMGIAGGKVYTNTGSVQTSNSTGNYEFYVEDGDYVVWPEVMINSGGYFYVLKNPQDSMVTVDGADEDNIDFRYADGISAGDICQIGGKVYHDTTGHIGIPAVPDALERGIAGVSVSVKGRPTIADSTNIMLSTTTDAEGNYLFNLPAGIYTITQVDSTGYYSTTPNVVVDTLVGTGVKHLGINFGDSRTGMGTIQIKVWNDINRDSTINVGEVGLGNVFCMVVNTNSGDLAASDRTDAGGNLTIFLPGDSLYNVIQIPPDSMISVCALYKKPSDANWRVSKLQSQVDSLFVPRDSTCQVRFADVVGYVAIPLGQTERVLSMILPDLREFRDPPGDKDNPLSYSADLDIVLGTVNSNGMISNLLVWYNRYRDASTTASALFPLAYDFSFNLGVDITALAGGNLNAYAPSTTEDVICGLNTTSQTTVTNNISVGLTHDGGPGVAAHSKGLVRNVIRNYSTINGYANAAVISLAAGLLTNSGRVDFVVGTRDANNLGHVEIWKNVGGSPPTFVRDTVMYHAGIATLGEVRTIFLADVVDSAGSKGNDLPQFYQDLIVGTKTGSYPSYSGQMVIYRRAGFNRRFVHQATYNVTDGYINALEAYVSGKASNSARDIICGLRTNGASLDDYRGRLELWHNNNNGNFGLAGYPNVVRATEGEALCLAAANLNLDAVPDVAVGLKFGDFVGGTRFYYNTPGNLAMAGADPSGGKFTGEVVTIKAGVLRPHTLRNDVVAGERFMSGGTGYGRVIIYHHKY